MSGNKALCVFAHYDRNDVVEPYVVYYLRSLRIIVDYLVFVSTSDSNKLDVSKVKEICDNVILRENVGHDFYSYRIGLESVDFSSFDQIVLCNDSVYGPMTNLKLLVEKAALEQWDFWGVTESFDPIYHLQSYFLVFQRRVIQSKEFSLFWSRVILLPSKDEIIERYEIGLSNFLLDAGFSAGAWFRSRKMTGFRRMTRYPRHYFEMLRGRWRDGSLYVGFLSKIFSRSGINTSHYEWKHMLISGRAVFLKVALIKGDSNVYNDRQQVIDMVAEHTTYPVELIRIHVEKI